jgi:hypothetical protein
MRSPSGLNEYSTCLVADMPSSIVLEWCPSRLTNSQLVRGAGNDGLPNAPFRHTPTHSDGAYLH